jgi:RND family efflux transporter MFP subunit
MSADAAVRQSAAMLEKARADVTAARVSVKVARADARRAMALRDYAKIVAPYDGVVTRRNVDVGDLTQPGSHGEPLFIVVRDDLVRLTVSVPEMIATEVDPGDRVEIRLQALRGLNLEGRVTRTSWTLDAKNRTLRTEIDLPNPNGKLRPGLYANVTVIAEEHRDVLTVPSSALVKDQSRACCVVVSDGKALRKFVIVGMEDGTRTEIVSGLDANDKVVKANSASLVDGQSVSATTAAAN